MTTLVCFLSDRAEYGVPIESVREVRPGGALVELPAARPGVAGLVSYGGESLAVLDVFDATGGNGKHHMLLLDHGDHGFGLLVDLVTRVVTVDGAIGPAPRGQAREYISGTVPTDDGPLLVVDVGALDESLG